MLLVGQCISLRSRINQLHDYSNDQHNHSEGIKAQTKSDSDIVLRLMKEENEPLSKEFTKLLVARVGKFTSVTTEW
jgi:hypothetical protein